MEMKLDVVRREVIKPSSPSPRDHLQLSILDLTCAGVYVPVIYFYKAADDDLFTKSPEIVCAKLKKSLSETLTRFYPLAGRIEGISISCTDEGAVFTEARTDLLLPDFLRNLNANSLEPLLPTMALGDSPTEWPLLSVKATFFGSGSGVAVVVSISHRICDAASSLAFTSDWAAITAQVKPKVSTIQFAETTIYPPPPHISFQSQSVGFDAHLMGMRCEKNRFVFESSKIAELKRKAASESVLMPTRVEAIMSLIWRCARNASRSNLVTPRSTTMFQAMDLRLRIPSMGLSSTAIGNLQTGFFLKNGPESELEIPETVAAFRRAKEGANHMIKENVQGNTLGQSLMSDMGNFMSEFKPDVDIYMMSSWCRKPFYEVDFGWGVPVWVGSTRHAIHDNSVYVGLIDSKDGEGVEALINLPEQDMSVFVRDEEMLAYAVLNPPVLI